MGIKNASLNLIKKVWFRISAALILSLILVMSVSKNYPTQKIENNAPLTTFTAHLDERIPILMKAYYIPGVNIALVKGGKTVWANAYGYADVETGRKMTLDTPLRVQSISKSVTAWGVMKLVEQGKIALDCPVQRYIRNWGFPESEFSDEKVTVRQLLSHTAGLPLGDFYNFFSPDEDIPSLEESLSNEAVLLHEPGSSFSYSNTGFNLLELLIEEVTGRDFAEYMQQEILNPLGMRNSSFTWSEEFDPPVPVGYKLSGEAVPVYVYPEKGSGGLFATVEDIAAFVTAGMTEFSQVPQVLDARSIHQLYTPQVNQLGVYSLVFDGYGLGHYLENLSNGKQAVSHGGQGTGWMTHFHAVPETGDGIVILTNSQRSWPFIAYILSDWATWSGFSSVGMGQIIIGRKMLWGFIGLIWVIVFWQVWRLGEDLIYRKREFEPRSKESLLFRLAQGSVSFILIASLWWCINQDYLFITSVFPITSCWLGVSVFAFAVALLLSVLFSINLQIIRL
jgi:CubicO group peptidase (beta-lactamase class C family)